MKDLTVKRKSKTKVARNPRKASASKDVVGAATSTAAIEGELVSRLQVRVRQAVQALHAEVLARPLRSLAVACGVGVALGAGLARPVFSLVTGPLGRAVAMALAQKYILPLAAARRR